MSDEIKVRKLKPSETIEVGDYIISKDWTGTKTHKVHRVTRTLAMIRWNDVAEGAFKRESVDKDGDVKPRGANIGSQVRYTAYRKTDTGEDQ